MLVPLGKTRRFCRSRLSNSSLIGERVLVSIYGQIIFFCLCCVAQAIEPCRIQVIDAENGWAVPLVELRTNHNERFVSDNAGMIAFDLPELMGRETWFSIEGHGYGVPADGFGYRGVRLTPQPGGKLTVKVERQLPAKRIGRLTGAGLFAESQKLGEELEWPETGVLGCDSVQIAEHRGRLFWAWGDTTLPQYPLGLFHMSSAITKLKPLASFEPPLKLRLEYSRDDKGKPRSVAEMAGEGPTWLSGYVSLPDRNGEKRLVATYVKIKGMLTAYETGLCVWNDEVEKFELHNKLWTKTDKSPDQPLAPEGHPVLWKDDAGKEWVLFGGPFPRLKCPATFEAWEDPKTWERLEPQATVASLDGKEQITPHNGSIAWNEFRKCWVAVFTQVGGKPSHLGEIWYAEADAPTGPWERAVKVVTHNNYTFYNPRLHPELTPPDSPILLFEGTYTALFADHAVPTPRYDYNQILYRLDLDDPTLIPISSR
jgi:hypothetical protein